MKRKRQALKAAQIRNSWLNPDAEKENMKTTKRDYIQSNVTGNLLLAHKRISETGSVAEVAYFTDYLMKFSKKIGNETISFGIDFDKERKTK